MLTLAMCISVVKAVWVSELLQDQAYQKSRDNAAQFCWHICCAKSYVETDNQA